MSDEDKKPTVATPAKREGIFVEMIRFVGVLDVPGDQVSNVRGVEEPAPGGRSYVTSYDKVAGMYRVSCYVNGGLVRDMFVPRERVQFHEVQYMGPK